jgi:hypothetical protein
METALFVPIEDLCCHGKRMGLAMCDRKLGGWFTKFIPWVAAPNRYFIEINLNRSRNPLFSIEKTIVKFSTHDVLKRHGSKIQS